MSGIPLSQTSTPTGFRSARGRPTAERTQAISRTILSAATEMFLAHGYDGASMDAVAERAGVPKSTLYKRYADKRDLLRAVIEARIAEWSVVAARRNWMLTDDLAQRLRHHAAWLLIWAGSPEVRAFTRLAASAWNAAEETERRRDIVGYRQMVEQIERDIVELGPRAAIDARDPRGVAEALMALLSGWLQLRASPGPVGEGEAAAYADTAVGLLLHGSAAW